MSNLFGPRAYRDKLTMVFLLFDQATRLLWTARACFGWAILGVLRTGFYLRFSVLFSAEKHPREQAGRRPDYSRGTPSALRTSVVVHAYFFLICFEAEGRVAALRAASRRSFGPSVQNKRSKGPFILKSIMGPSDPLCDYHKVRRTLLLRA